MKFDINLSAGHWKMLIFLHFIEIIMWEDHRRRGAAPLSSGATSQVLQDNIYNKLSNVVVFGHNELWVPKVVNSLSVNFKILWCLPQQTGGRRPWIDSVVYQMLWSLATTYDGQKTWIATLCLLKYCGLWP